MRKVIAFLHVSLDGFAAGPNGELDWAIVDSEIEPYVDNLIKTVDTALYGRVTYHMMESYWPTVPANPSSTKHDIDHAHWVENVSKIVFSKTLEKVEWNNTRLVKDNIAEEISKLKQQSGGDMMIFGSPGIVHLLTQHGLIDEYQINVNPLLLGSGIPLLKGIKDKISLKLLEVKPFRSGVVGLRYQRIS
jgi:dihydrofolate reductase